MPTAARRRRRLLQQEAAERRAGAAPDARPGAVPRSRAAANGWPGCRAGGRRCDAAGAEAISSSTLASAGSSARPGRTEPTSVVVRVLRRRGTSAAAPTPPARSSARSARSHRPRSRARPGGAPRRRGGMPGAVASRCGHAAARCGRIARRRARAARESSRRVARATAAAGELARPAASCRDGRGARATLLRPAGDQARRAAAGDARLPTQRFVGLTSEQLTRSPTTRLLPFMAHDRATLAGVMIALGALYTGLALNGLARWEWAALTTSAALGFATFALFIGYGYVRPAARRPDAAARAAFVLTIKRRPPRGFAPRRSPTCTTTTPWRRAQRGQLAARQRRPRRHRRRPGHRDDRHRQPSSSPADLAFLQTTREQLEAIDPQLISLIAHDRAGFGGALAAAALGLLIVALRGIQTRRPQALVDARRSRAPPASRRRPSSTRASATTTCFTSRPCSSPQCSTRAPSSACIPGVCSRCRRRGLLARERGLAPARRLGVLDQPREVVGQVRAADARGAEQLRGRASRRRPCPCRSTGSRPAPWSSAWAEPVPAVPGGDHRRALLAERGARSSPTSSSTVQASRPETRFTTPEDDVSSSRCTSASAT